MWRFKKEAFKAKEAETRNIQKSCDGGGRSWKTCEPMRKDEKGGESETRVAILVPVRNYILETRFFGKTCSDKAQRFLFDVSDKSSFTFDGKYHIHLTIQGFALV